MSDFEARFGGIQRLYGREGLARLRAAHVAVIGVGGVGSWAVEALAKRTRAINPETVIAAKQDFFTADTADALLREKFDFVVDAIDTLANKALLIAECRRRDLRVITSGGAGGRKDGTAVRVADLAQASHDPLLQKLRKKLRAEYGFSPDPKLPFGIPAVFSPELPTPPESCEAGLRMDCNSGYGAVTFVTGVFGFAAAGWVVNAIAAG